MISKKEIRDFIIKSLQRKKKIPQVFLNNIDSFNYLLEGQIDSLELIHFIISIEERFKFSFSEKNKESEQFRTVGGLTNLIYKKLSN